MIDALYAVAIIMLATSHILVAALAYAAGKSRRGTRVLSSHPTPPEE